MTTVQSNYLQNTDLELVSNILKGHTNSFTLLYKRYYGKVFSKCFQITKSRDLSEDLSQDIFMKLYLQLHKFDKRSSFSTWLYAIVNNYCIDYIRKQKHKISFTEIENSALNISSDKEAELEQTISFLDQDVKELLKILSSSEQQLLNWKYLEKLSIKQIKQKTNLSESAVKMRLKRAKEKVAKNNFFCKKSDLSMESSSNKKTII